MSKVNNSHSSSLSEEEQSNCISIIQQKIVLKNEPCEVIELVNNLILEFGEVRTTKCIDLLWNSSVNTRAKTIPYLQNCFILFQIANLKHKFLYLNYKYSPIRNKSKKYKKSNNTSYKQQPLLEANDIIKSRKIESNKNTKLLEIKETQALSDYNDCQNNSTTPNLFIEPPLSLY
ncbi:9411_t:CDS:2, partial [Racocetra persica]